MGSLCSYLKALKSVNLTDEAFLSYIVADFKICLHWWLKSKLYSDSIGEKPIRTLDSFELWYYYLLYPVLLENSWLSSISEYLSNLCELAQEDNAIPKYQGRYSFVGNLSQRTI